MDKATILLADINEADAIGIYLDNFLGKIKSLATKYKVEIKTDLTKLRKDILKGKLPDSVKIVMPIGEELTDRKRAELFKKDFHKSLKSLVGFLKTIRDRGKDIDIKKIIEPLAKLELNIGDEK
jgi:hypothetical protein